MPVTTVTWGCGLVLAAEAAAAAAAESMESHLLLFLSSVAFADVAVGTAAGANSIFLLAGRSSGRFSSNFLCSIAMLS